MAVGRPGRQKHPAVGVAGGVEPIDLVQQPVCVAVQWPQWERFVEVRRDAAAGCQGQPGTSRDVAVEAFRDLLANLSLVVEELTEQVVADGCIRQPSRFGRSFDGPSSSMSVTGA